MEKLFFNGEKAVVTIAHSKLPICEEMICSVMEVEKEVYRPEDRGTLLAIVNRMNKYPEMLISAQVDEKMVGYLCYFPISEKLYLDIVNDGNYRDDDIQPEDVVPFSQQTHLFLISAAICPAFQNKGIADYMMQYMNSQIHNKCAQGYAVKDITTITISPDGEKLAKRYGFRLHFEDNRGYKVFKKILENQS